MYYKFFWFKRQGDYACARIKEIDTEFNLKYIYVMPDTVIDSLSENQPLQKIYDSLVGELKKLVRVKIEPKKSSVHVKAKSTLAGIHLRKDHLIIQIVSEKPLKSARVFKIEQVSKNRVHNHVRIREEKEIDGELRGWLKRAYALMA